MPIISWQRIWKVWYCYVIYEWVPSLSRRISLKCVGWLAIPEIIQEYILEKQEPRCHWTKLSFFYDVLMWNKGVDSETTKSILNGLCTVRVIAGKMVQNWKSVTICAGKWLSIVAFTWTLLTKLSIAWKFESTLYEKNTHFHNAKMVKLKIEKINIVRVWAGGESCPINELKLSEICHDFSKARLDASYSGGRHASLNSFKLKTNLWKFAKKLPIWSGVVYEAIKL